MYIKSYTLLPTAFEGISAIHNCNEGSLCCSMGQALWRPVPHNHQSPVSKHISHSMIVTMESSVPPLYSDHHHCQVCNPATRELTIVKYIRCSYIQHMLTFNCSMPIYSTPTACSKPTVLEVSFSDIEMSSNWLLCTTPSPTIVW